MTALEIAANAVMALSIGLAARNSVHTWPTGVLGCFLLAIVFVGNQLYADATLQLFFIATSLVGWWHWLHPTRTVDAVQRPISKTRPQTLFWMTIAALAVTLLYGWMLHQLTDAYLPYIDSAVLALSVIAQCLLMQRKVDTWPFWLAVNTISVALFASRGLTLTAALYAAYWINAWYGWWRWHRERAQPTALLHVTS